MWDNVSVAFVILLYYILILNNVPVGDMGNLCPSYAFSFSTLLLKILLLREADTLSIPAPNRMLNCWVGFGFSSCPMKKHKGKEESAISKEKIM